jgi:hypothetical protein
MKDVILTSNGITADCHFNEVLELSNSNVTTPFYFQYPVIGSSFNYARRWFLYDIHLIQIKVCPDVYL